MGTYKWLVRDREILAMAPSNQSSSLKGALVTSPIESTLRQGETSALRGSFESAGLTWEGAHQAGFATYKTELRRWNRRVNLVSRRDEDRIVEAHFVDSLRVLPFLPEAGSGALVLDIGTGAGLPGLVVKIARPDLEVVLLDSARKKRIFLMHMISALDLTHVRVLDSRAEALAEDERYRDRFEVVLSRAVGSLSAVIPLAAPFVAPEGRMITFKQLDPGPEIRASIDIALSFGLKDPVVLQERIGAVPRRGSLVQFTKRAAMRSRTSGAA